MCKATHDRRDANVGHHLEGKRRAQHDSDTLGSEAFFGTILRIDVDKNTGPPPYYGIPSGNPFEAPLDSIKDEIWAKGFRHPWRFSFDRANADLWIGDVGEVQREEE